MEIDIPSPAFEVKSHELTDEEDEALLTAWLAWSSLKSPGNLVNLRCVVERVRFEVTIRRRTEKISRLVDTGRRHNDRYITNRAIKMIANLGAHDEEDI